MPNANAIDITGQIFGRLTAIKYVDTLKGRLRWLYRCECDNKCIKPWLDVKCGKIQSCGCLYKQTRFTCHYIHGNSKHPLYKRFIYMHRRCEEPKCKDYKNYGGRGISVCDEWSGPSGFDCFYAWAEPLFKPGLQIDRKNNERGYYPKNCHFVTHAVNMKNTRKAKKYN